MNRVGTANGLALLHDKHPLTSLEFVFEPNCKWLVLAVVASSQATSTPREATVWRFMAEIRFACHKDQLPRVVPVADFGFSHESKSRNTSFPRGEDPSHRLVKRALTHQIALGKENRHANC